MLRRVVRPHAREAVGLQLGAHRLALGAGVAVVAAEGPEQVLDVMSVLVGDDVALGERATLRAELCPELVEEAEVEVDEPVGRAVERPGRGARRAAAGVGRVGEQHGVDRLVCLARARELVGPVLLHAVDVAEDAAVVAGVGVLAGLAVGGERRAARTRHRTRLEDRAEVVRVAAEQRVGEQQDQADRATATDGDAAAAHPAAVGDLAWVELGAWVEGHGRLFSWVRARSYGTWHGAPARVAARRRRNDVANGCMDIRPCRFGDGWQVPADGSGAYCDGRRERTAGH